MDGTFDAIIVGGGPAGGAAAITLGRAGVPTLLIEARRFAEWKIGDTLVPESSNIFKVLLIWDKFKKQDFLSSPGNCSVWGRDRVTQQQHILNPYGCGWQLDRARFEKLLIEEARGNGVEIRLGVSAHEFQWQQGVWIVRVGSHSFKTKWLLDASGRRAVIARSVGIKRTAIDKLVSIYVAGTTPDRSDKDARIFVEACSDGWWYSALRPSGFRILGFQTDADLLNGQKWRTPKWFQMRLEETKHMRHVLQSSNYSFQKGPKLTSAHSGRLQASAGENWIAIGDAAQSIDPLSGQGILNALITGHSAAKHLIEALKGRSQLVEKYTKITDSLWSRFLDDRLTMYSAESRWAESPFWIRRKETENAQNSTSS